MIDDIIKKFYQEYCKDEGIKFSEKEFGAFLDFLDIDLYDWFKENINQFYKQKLKI